MSNYRKARQIVGMLKESDWVIKAWDELGVERTVTIQPDARWQIAETVLDTIPEADAQTSHLRQKDEEWRGAYMHRLERRLCQLESKVLPRKPVPARKARADLLVEKWDALAEKHIDS